ncbi:MAG: GNAT family N-acetyltransferase [Anaerolineaceae bacterium]|nr:GNAT family N-acetyltransferase [Anaerolineaceae bacterium]
MNPKRHIECSETQDIDGLNFRHFAGNEDYQLMLDLYNATKETNGIDWTSTLKDMKNDEKWRKHYDINKQLLFVEMNEKPIGYFQYNWFEEDEGEMIHSLGGTLLEDYFNTGIPEVMLSFAERKLKEMTENIPAKKEKLYSLWRMQSAEKQVEFFKANDYQPVRYFFEMLRPIDKPLDKHPLPEGLEIREVKPEHHRKIWEAEHEAFRDHWGYSEPTEDQYEAWSTDRLFRPRFWKVAWEGDEICGMVGNFFDEKENKEFNRQRGYTEDIFVRRPWRKRGLAKALVAESIRMFKDMGMTETALGVDAENPSGALKLYTDMGYKEEKDKTSIVLRKKAA